MIRFNREKLRDKIYACWTGKNIGGTMGTPFEGRQQVNDIQGFTSPKGAALANDDLDLQLVWLKAVEDRGPYNLNAQILGEYWINFIPPHWNEYGIGKANMRAGLLPPLSGHYNNNWKHSNGAWIRSEIWACLAPGCPDVAIKYAVEDACVDHGMGEGTYAEIFTAAVESAAFVISDIRELIKIGLSKIPEDCRVAKSIRLVTESYDKGIDWKVLRENILETNSDLGWFQAPGNVAFTMLGMLYGEGDFKKSMILAINCGDDTDCTGGTLGALYGIMNGTAGIPEDWSSYIGDNIVTIAVDRGSCHGLPKTCSDLTDRVMSLVPVILKANKAAAGITDGESNTVEATPENLKKQEVSRKLCSRPGLSYNIDFIYASAMVQFEADPVIVPNGSLDVKVTFTNQMPDPKHLQLRWLLPEGWSVSGMNRAYVGNTRLDLPVSTYSAVITAGGAVQPVNRLILEVTCPGRPSAGLIPVTILG